MEQPAADRPRGTLSSQVAGRRPPLERRRLERRRAATRAAQPPFAVPSAAAWGHGGRCPTIERRWIAAL